MEIGATIRAGSKIPSLEVDFYVVSYKDYLVQNTLRALRDYGMPYFLFPDIYLSETRPEVWGKYKTILNLAKEDRGYFVRKDENPDGTPLSGIWYDTYRKNIEALKNPITVSGRFMNYPSAKHIVEDKSDYVFLSQIIGDKHHPITINSFEHKLLKEKKPEKVVLLSSASIKDSLRLLRSLE